MPSNHPQAVHLNTKLISVLEETGFSNYQLTIMKKILKEVASTHCIKFFVFFIVLLFMLNVDDAFAQNVGIGTPTPLAKLHVAEKSVAFTATGEAPDTPVIAPVTGVGRRLMWFAEKGALVSGYMPTSLWDGPQIGKYSFAGGFNCSAQGDNSIAFGVHSFALHAGSFALGENCVAGGVNSLAVGNQSSTFDEGASAVAMGFSAHAYAPYSIALGYQTTATSEASVAIGYQANSQAPHAIAIGESTTAIGIHSTAMGSNSSAWGISSMAIGDNVTATGDYSIALGSNVSTTNHSGCLTIGDHSTTVLMNTFVDNGFRARFAGGYRLFTTSDVTVGAFLNAGANSWAALSDIRMKENFLRVNGESILERIANMPQFTWNYKGQDVRKDRHYGPMGQEFFKAFGHDQLGEIGCDTLINQQDFLGVSFVAIQALEKRTEEIKDLRKMILQLRKEIEELKKKVRKN